MPEPTLWAICTCAVVDGVCGGISSNALMSATPQLVPNCTATAVVTVGSLLRLPPLPPDSGGRSGAAAAQPWPPWCRPAGRWALAAFGLLAVLLTGLVAVLPGLRRPRR